MEDLGKVSKKGVTQISLSKQFGITQPAISYLVNGKTKLRKKNDSNYLCY